MFKIFLKESEEDKLIERDRYDNKSNQKLNDKTTNLGSKSVSLSLREPYLFYEKVLKELVNKKMHVLEIGAGSGRFSELLIENSLHFTAIDISPKSLDLLREIYKSSNISTIVGDIEKLPFKKNTFDLVASAGSLSYGDNYKVLKEIYRVLKKDGIFVCIDSLNHNIIYVLNRFFHFIKGNRSLSTLFRIPKVNLIKDYDKKFGYSQVRYFGLISWLTPIINIVGNESLSFKLSKFIDKKFNFLRHLSFKFVLFTKKMTK